MLGLVEFEKDAILGMSEFPAFDGLGLVEFEKDAILGGDHGLGETGWGL